MEEAEEVCQSVKLQRQKEEEVRKIVLNHDRSNSYFDLASRFIYIIPDELFMLSNIEHLYLETNNLEELPDDFFDNLPQLKWLDLRDNKLVWLPPSIGFHRNLKNILLEKNQLTHLPLELGNVHTITGLSLRGNPLVMPPPHVVEQGVQIILSYLLDELNNVGDLTEREDENRWQYADDGDYSEEDDDDRFDIQSAQNGLRTLENDMTLHGPTPVPAMFHHPKSRNKHTNGHWRDKTLLDSPTGSVKVNQLKLVNESSRGHKTVISDRKNWLAKMQQKRQDTTVLDEWRKEAKRLQSILIPKSKADLNHVLPPYGIDLSAEGGPVTEEERKIHIDAVEVKVDRVEPKNTNPKERIDNEVQSRIRQHTSQLRFRKQKNMNDYSIPPGRELQRELLNQKMIRDAELEYRFRAFTGDSSSFSSSKRTSSL